MDVTRRSILRAGAAAVAAGTLGLVAGCFGQNGQSTRSPRGPRATFRHRYFPVSEDGGRVRIVHAGGDALNAAALFVVGDGFETVPEVDQTKQGPWQGEVTGGKVAEGDVVLVGATKDYELTLSYQTGDEAVTLDSLVGPGA